MDLNVKLLFLEVLLNFFVKKYSKNCMGNSQILNSFSSKNLRLYHYQGKNVPSPLPAASFSFFPNLMVYQSTEDIKAAYSQLSVQNNFLGSSCKLLVWQVNVIINKVWSTPNLFQARNKSKSQAVLKTATNDLALFQLFTLKYQFSRLCNAYEVQVYASTATTT